MEDVSQYRDKILQILLAARTESGEPRLAESKARALAKEFTDQELLDGMDFNTPEDVAQMLLDSGL